MKRLHLRCSSCKFYVSLSCYIVGHLSSRPYVSSSRSNQSLTTFHCLSKTSYVLDFSRVSSATLDTVLLARPPSPFPAIDVRCLWSPLLFAVHRLLFAMPKQLRSTVQGQYRANSVITTAATRHVQYADAFALPIQDMQPYNMPQMNIPPSPQSVSPPNRPQPQVVYQNPPQSPYEPQPQQNYYHHPQHPSPASQPTPAAPPQVPRSRRITGAWTQEADDVLIEARGNGWPWARIQAEKFPNKSPNACRKRYERLIARKEANEWGAMRDEKMAKEYMTIRKEMWTLLAQRTGDKWDVLEKKVSTH